MADIELVGNIAKETLTAGAGAWLWERACRVAGNAERIASMVEKSNANVPIDKFCLTAAGYFSDSGLVYKRKKDKPQFVDIDPKEIAELSIMMVNEKLGQVLTAQRLSSVNNIIGESQDRFTKLVEAMVLSDAVTLDEMGPTGVMSQYRKFVVEGKGAGEFVQNFKRKMEYKYFDARLKEGFKFDEVRTIAAERFEMAKQFVFALDSEGGG